MFGGLSGAAGSIAGAAIQANAAKEAAKMQIDALEKSQKFIFENLDPDIVNAQATQASIDQAINRLALQGKVDPELLAQRYASEEQISKLASELGQGEAQAVGTAAAAEALTGKDTAAQGKQALIDAALEQIKLGATLPPDVQAELVQSGLEKVGKSTGQATATGQGGTLLRKILGTAGINLQMQRQQQAAALMDKAQALESSRAQILQGLFPNLSATQLNTLKGAQGVLQQSDTMVPNAGLTAQDIANIWLGRVGQTANITQQIGKVGAEAKESLGTAWSGAAGGISSGLSKAGSAAWPTVSGWLSGSGVNQYNAPEAWAAGF